MLFRICIFQFFWIPAFRFRQCVKFVVNIHLVLFFSFIGPNILRDTLLQSEYKSYRAYMQLSRKNNFFKWYSVRNISKLFYKSCQEGVELTEEALNKTWILKMKLKDWK